MNESNLIRIVNYFSILITLVKRDYVMQFAGSILGSIWLILQSTILVLLYIFIINGLNISIKNNTGSLPFVLSGLLFWIPLSEMTQRSTSILTDNRNLIKRSNLKIHYFLAIPLLQMLFHFTLISIPIFSILYFQSLLSPSSFIVFPYILGLGLISLPLNKFLARSNVILKDISPVVRLLLQIIFWTLPIIYSIPEKFMYILQYHPFLPFLDLFRLLLLGTPLEINYFYIFVLIIISISFHFLTKLRFNKIISDHL
jgi:lipopolysaccharide transport system permease protein